MEATGFSGGSVCVWRGINLISFNFQLNSFDPPKKVWCTYYLKLVEDLDCFCGRVYCIAGLL